MIYKFNPSSTLKSHLISKFLFIFQSNCVCGIDFAVVRLWQTRYQLETLGLAGTNKILLFLQFYRSKPTIVHVETFAFLTVPYPFIHHKYNTAAAVGLGNRADSGK